MMFLPKEMHVSALKHEMGNGLAITTELGGLFLIWGPKDASTVH